MKALARFALGSLLTAVATGLSRLDCLVDANISFLVNTPSLHMKKNL